MEPVQSIRVGLGDEAIHLPLLRLPYVNGADSTARPGGFFTSKDGEIGLAVMAGTTPEDVQAILAEELREHGAFVADALFRHAQAKRPGAAGQGGRGIPPHASQRS